MSDKATTNIISPTKVPCETLLSVGTIFFSGGTIGYNYVPPFLQKIMQLLSYFLSKTTVSQLVIYHVMINIAEGLGKDETYYVLGQLV